MSGWTTHTGIAVTLPVNNIDTDQLIPARFMSRPRVDGYGDLLLYDFRRTDSGAQNKDFVLNRFPQASVLIAGSNFGTGSSREAAVYALMDAGIQVVVATSFGDIFTANAINNGLLPARIAEEEHQQLLSCIEKDGVELRVDLDGCSIEWSGRQIKFNMGSAQLHKLINGLDDINMTLQYQKEIADYKEKRLREESWTFPSG